MKKCILVVSCAFLMPALAAAQSGQGAGVGSGSSGDQATTSSSSSSSSTTTQKDGRAQTTVATKIEDAGFNPRFVRTLTNVQIELTLTDQMGTAAPEKKVVSMIVSSGNWGKIRSAGSVVQIGDVPYGVDLNVDARPYVSTDGQIQLEMTLNYAPPKSAPDSPREPRQRPTGINQSQTVVLQSGKPLVISQAADPMSDRKVTVEIKATVLK